MKYDPLNRLTNMVDAAGTTVYTYGNIGQLLSEDGPWANDTVNYTYTTRRLTGASLDQPSASPWAVTYGYDSISRLTNITSPAGAFGYNYNVGQSVSGWLTPQNVSGKSFSGPLDSICLKWVAKLVGCKTLCIRPI